MEMINNFGMDDKGLDALIPVPLELQYDRIIAERNFEAQLRLRFQQYLAIGKRLIACHVLTPEQLMALRAPSERVLSEYCDSLDQTHEHHPSIHAGLVEDTVNMLPVNEQESLRLVLQRRDARMLTKLIQSLSAMGTDAENFRLPWNNGDDVTLEDGTTLLPVLEQLNQYMNFMRSRERNTVRLPKHSLKATYERFITEKARQVKPDTINQFQTSFDFLIRLLGPDFDVHCIDRETASRVKNAVLDLDVNHTKGCTGRKLAVKTANRYLINFATFMKWCRNHISYDRAMPFEGMLLSETTGNRVKRRKFAVDELELMKSYCPGDMREAKGIRNSIHWYMLLGMYTGMRLNEIAGIRLTSIDMQDGINYFDLTDRHLKSEAAERLVPIHSKLEQAGFLAYVQQCREAGHTFLFEELHEKKIKPGKYGFGEPMSRWFNRSLLKNLGIDKERELEEGYLVDFHCFRKTVLNRFKHHGVSAYIVRQLVGHDRMDDITFDSGYGEGESTHLGALKRIIEFIDY